MPEVREAIEQKASQMSSSAEVGVFWVGPGKGRWELGLLPVFLVAVEVLENRLGHQPVQCPHSRRGMHHMPQKQILDNLSIYIPQLKMEQKPIERLLKLGEKRDRSVNYLVVEAILAYLDRHEKEEKKA